MNIVCIDLTKYNYEQLTKVSEIIGIVDGSLQQDKKNGVKKVFLDPTARTTIGLIVSDPENYLRTYKGLVLCEEYSHLTKKEKDKLLKMEGSKLDFKRKKNSVHVVEGISVPEVLELDAILDKIGKLGIDSLTQKEKEFLDNISKS
jgi:hypothetical protein